MSNGQTGAMVQDNTWTWVSVGLIIFAVLAIGVIVTLLFFIGTRSSTSTSATAQFPQGNVRIRPIEQRNQLQYYTRDDFGNIVPIR